MDYLDELIQGMKNLQLDLELRIFDEPSENDRSRLLTAGYVVGMIGSQIDMLSQVDGPKREQINKILSNIEHRLARNRQGNGKR